MKNSILNFIITSKKKGKKLLAILLDPDKINPTEIEAISKNINKSPIDLIFVGGSIVSPNKTQKLIPKLKKYVSSPILIFPGDVSQISNCADGILFLSLLSGDNPEYLIRQQIKATSILKKTNLQIIPTGYILIDGGNKTTVQRISNTKPISQTNISKIVDIAITGVYLGKQLIYLETGSGAKNPVNSKIISSVKKNIELPIIVGGGILSKEAVKSAHKNGADIVVIGTAFEKDEYFLKNF